MQRKLWNKDFILLLQGSSISVIGDLMYSVAIGFWVYQQTGSSSLMGIMSSISMFMTMFLSPFCGSIVDKCNRKWVIVGIDLIQGLIMLGVGALAYMDSLNVPIILITAVLASLGSVFYSPAISTLMLDIIPRDDMVRGQSIFSSRSSLINLAGSAFSGVIIAFWGVPLIIVINGLSNLYSAVSELFIHVPRTLRQGMPVTVKGILHDSRAAVRTVFTNPFLCVFVPCALILNLLGAGPFSLILPFCMEKGFSVETYGCLVAVFTVSRLLCVTLFGIIKLKPQTRFCVMAFSFSASLPMYVLAYLSEQFILMCIFAFAAGFLNCAGNALFNSALMLALPEKNRSAILGCIDSASVGGSALSVVIYGLLGDVFPLDLVFAVGSAISLIPMLYLCLHPKTKLFMLKHCK